MDAAYTGLVTTARALGKSEIADLLQQNLEQETAMLEKATRTHDRLVGTQLPG